MWALAADAGLRIASPVELQNGAHFDVGLPRVLATLVAWLRCGLVWALVLAPPCTLWSAAHAAHGAPSKNDPCKRALVRLLRVAHAAGVRVLVENPASSRLWQWPLLRRLLSRMGCEEVVLDMCCYDAAWKKPTRWVGNVAGLAELALRCPGHAAHVRLQGTVQTEHGRTWRTKFAAAYPPRLCRSLADLLCRAAPRSAWRRHNEERIAGHWERGLAAASGTVLGGPLVVPPSRRRCTLGWEGSRQQWGGAACAEEGRILREIFLFNRRSQTAASPAGTSRGRSGRRPC